MTAHRRHAWGIVLLCLLAAAGCASPYRADRGALAGGLLGAGTGALVGNALGNTGAGAVIGAGVGAISGGVIGGELDNIEAENRANVARIESQMGRQVAAGAVSMEDVVAMTQAGVDEAVIVNHVRMNGTSHPLQPGDLISLQNAGVSPRVVQAMQTPPVQRAVVQQPPPPVYVERVYDPYWGPPPHYYYHHHPRRCYGPPRPGFSWGVSVAH
ncbi:MAG: glycine zipper domain-containing protein [Pirellulales bacterium]